MLRQERLESILVDDFLFFADFLEDEIEPSPNGPDLEVQGLAPTIETVVAVFQLVDFQLDGPGIRS